MGAYSRWALIRGWALVKFPLFSASVVCLFCNKSKKGNNKTRRCNKASFCKILWRKFRLRGSLSLVPIHFCWVEGGRGVGFGCGRLFEFEWKGEGVGVYSRLGAY